jgi:hypothetical protein
MAEWPTKTCNQFLFGFFVQLKIPVPPLSGIHAHGRFIIVVFFFSELELFWRGWEYAEFTILLPGR